MTNTIFRAVAVILFVVSLPVLVITTSVKLLVFDPSFYDSNQATNGVLTSSGLPAPVLQAANKSLTGYFKDKDATLDSELKRHGLPVDFFSKRESDHLVDVKDLIWVAMGAQQTTLGYALLFLVASLLFRPRRFLHDIRAPLVWGAGLTMALLMIFGILSQMDFSGIFLLFHIVSFSNDLWMLNPTTDVLLRMVPERFFLYFALTIGAYSALQALGIGVIGVLLYWRRLGIR